MPLNANFRHNLDIFKKERLYVSSIVTACIKTGRSSDELLEVERELEALEAALQARKIELKKAKYAFLGQEVETLKSRQTQIQNFLHVRGLAVRVSVRESVVSGFIVRIETIDRRNWVEITDQAYDCLANNLPLRLSVEAFFRFVREMEGTVSA